MPLRHILISFISFCLAVILQRFLDLNPVMVASGIALVGTVCFENTDYRNIIYVSVFCSMGSAFSDRLFILHGLFISILISIIYCLVTQRYIGHGGKLGSIAFAGSGIYFLALGIL